MFVIIALPAKVSLLTSFGPARSVGRISSRLVKEAETGQDGYTLCLLVRKYPGLLRWCWRLILDGVVLPDEKAPQNASCLVIYCRMQIPQQDGTNILVANHPNFGSPSLHGWGNAV